MKTYLSSSFAKKCFTVATLFFFLMGQSAFAAVSLTNGNFSDTSGMSDIGGGWYDGVPTGWSTTGANQYVINNEVLNLDHVGTFSQTLGVVDAGAEDVTVSFQYGDIWNGGYYAANEDMITAELWDTTTTTLLVSKTVKNTGSYGSFVSDSLSATATAGNTLQVRFSSLVGTGVTPGDAAALDNVSVTAVDATAPIITNISSDKADGTYTIGEVIDIDVTFSENVSGTMTLTLDSGGTCDITVAASNTSTCDYTVAAAQNSLDLTLASATGTVTDAASNPMTNFVPTVNLAANKALVISTPVPPTLTEVTPVTTPTFDTTPTYVFHSTEAGDITYSGGCTSSTTTAVVGNNTITFDSLAVGTYDCTITVTDIDTEFRDLPVTQFVISPVVPNTIVVNSLNTGSWGHAQETATGTGAYALTPVAPPLGSGAFQMDINASGGYYLGAPLYSNTRLADITELLYSTYRASVDAGNNLAIALQLNVDYDTNDSTSTWQGRLVYEPYNTPGIGGTVMQDTWYNWNTLTGRWWMTGNAIVGNVNVGKACTQGAPCTWSDLLLAYPNAAISSAVGFKAGSNWGPAGFSGFVDNFNIAIKDTGIDTTYNFEFDTTTPSAGEVTPVPAITNDETPEYTFTTDEAGTITYGGSCSGSTTTAVVGNNVISFDTLVDGNYADCTITVTDIASNQITFSVSPFVVDTVAPTTTSVSIVSNNAVSTVAKESDAITVSFVTSETVTTPVVTIAGKNATVSTLGNNHTATYTLTATEVQGPAAISINFSDSAGNPATEITDTTDSSFVTIDTNAPNALFVQRPSQNEVIETETSLAEGSCETGTTVTISGGALQINPTTTTCVAGKFAVDITFSPTALNTTFALSFTQKDLSGNVSSPIIYDINYRAKQVSSGGSGPANTDFVNTNTANPPAPAPANPTPTPTPEPQTPQAPIPETPTENPTPENNPIPTPETPANPETNPEETPTPTPAPTPAPTPTPATGGGTTGGTGGNPAPFNPVDATLDIGGGTEPDATATVEEGFDPVDATLDEGGGEPGQERSYTLLWILLGLLALLNTWWFFVAKNKQNIHRN